MIRRAMTLLETLLALALLSAIAAACALFIQTAVRHAAPLARQREWELAAHAVLQQMHDDLLVGDSPADPADPKAVSAEGVLTLRTRVAAPGLFADIVVYRHDRERGCLIREFAGPHAIRPAPLLAELAAFAADADTDARTLTVHLGSTAGASFSRRYVLP